jgi:hypothetical protein
MPPFSHRFLRSTRRRWMTELCTGLPPPLFTSRKTADGLDSKAFSHAASVSWASMPCHHNVPFATHKGVRRGKRRGQKQAQASQTRSRLKLLPSDRLGVLLRALC